MTKGGFLVGWPGLASALVRAESEWYNYWSQPEPEPDNTDFPWPGARASEEQGRSQRFPSLSLRSYAVGQSQNNALLSVASGEAVSVVTRGSEGIVWGVVSGQDIQTSVIRELCRITAVSSPWSLVTAAADPGLALVSAGPLAGHIQRSTKQQKYSLIISTLMFCSVSQNWTFI